jgi:hypothetical protein
MRPDPREHYVEYLTSRWPYLQRTAFLLCGDEHRAEDVVQETAIRLYLKWHRVQAADNMNASDNPPTLSLSRNGQAIGSVNDFTGDFTVPAAAGTYCLTLTEDAGAVVPISIRSNTTWTFRSTGPSGDGSAVLPLLSVEYGLPLDTSDHPVGNRATFTVKQASEVPVQAITGVNVWTSTDDGTTWQPAAVQPGVVGGVFGATLPAAASGQAVSLRVAVTAAGGSRIDQTIIRAYIAR